MLSRGPGEMSGRDCLVALVVAVGLLAIETESFDDGQIVEAEQAGVLAVRRIAVLVPRPGRNAEDVALLPLQTLAGALAIQAEVGDASDPGVAGRLLDCYEPEVVVLVAGAAPLMRPLHHQTWETFSINWHTDVRIAFHWLREALLKPLRPGSRVVVVSSGVAGTRGGAVALLRGPRSDP